jgi:energy-coupling factor transporter ATP-binding protein EcfA2
MKLIALVGEKQSGKSTTLNIINKTHETEELVIAGLLKDVCSKIYNINRVYFDDPKSKEVSFKDLGCGFDSITLAPDDLIQCLKYCNIEPDSEVVKHVSGSVITTPRKLAQVIGTNLMRAHDPDVHFNDAYTRASKDKINVASDVRFPNEFDFFHGKGAVTIYVFRPDKINTDTHESEAYVKSIGQNCKYKVENSGTLEDLENKIKEILKKENL